MTRGVAGQTYSSAELALTPRWSVEPADGVEAIGRFTDGPVAAASTKFQDIRSIYIGTVDHTSNLKQGTCFSAGCHTAIHGSNINNHLRY